MSVACSFKEVIENPSKWAVDVRVVIVVSASAMTISARVRVVDDYAKGNVRQEFKSNLCFFYHMVEMVRLQLEPRDVCVTGWFFLLPNQRSGRTSSN